MDKEIYMKNLWNKYQQTKDLKFLIEACDNAPFFGNPEMGIEIARILKKIKSSGKKNFQIININ